MGPTPGGTYGLYGVGPAAVTYTRLGGDVKNRWLGCVWAWARLAGVEWVGGDAKKSGHRISAHFPPNKKTVSKVRLKNMQ